MKLFKHTGNGHYIGSQMVVFADSMPEAETLIRIELDTSGLQRERLNVVEVPMALNTFVVSDDGDY